MGEGKMAFISRDDCATAAAYAAMSEDIDKVLNINGAELLTIADFLEIASEVTGRKWYINILRMMRCMHILIQSGAQNNRRNVG